MKKNKTAKYLKYAVGEIVLVVIGIIIALSINNWNEVRKEAGSNIKFLKNLHGELKLDTTLLSEKIALYLYVNGQLAHTLELLDGKSELTEKEYKTISSAIADLPVLTPIYKNIEKNNTKLADGTLLNINNQLNIKYQQYIEETKSNSEIINKLGETLQLTAIHDVHPNVDLDYSSEGEQKADFNIDELKSNRLFKNAINKSIRFRRIYIIMMRRQKRKANELLSILDEELKNESIANAKN